MGSALSAQQQVMEWNACYPPGTPVRVLRDNGIELETTTRSEAQLIAKEVAVVFVDTSFGCYLLDRLQPMEARHGS